MKTTPISTLSIRVLYPHSQHDMHESHEHWVRTKFRVTDIRSSMTPCNMMNILLCSDLPENVFPKLLAKYHNKPHKMECLCIRSKFTDIASNVLGVWEGINLFKSVNNSTLGRKSHWHHFQRTRHLRKDMLCPDDTTSLNQISGIFVSLSRLVSESRESEDQWRAPGDSDFWPLIHPIVSKTFACKWMLQSASFCTLFCLYQSSHLILLCLLGCTALFAHVRRGLLMSKSRRNVLISNDSALLLALIQLHCTESSDSSALYWFTVLI